MADVAIGKPCPHCGTFSAYSGTRNDEELTAQCACCGKCITIPNPEYRGPHPLTASVLALDAEVKRLTAENASLKAELAEYAKPPTVPPAPSNPIVGVETPFDQNSGNTPPTV